MNSNNFQTFEGKCYLGVELDAVRRVFNYYSTTLGVSYMENQFDDGDILITRRHTQEYTRQYSLKTVLGSEALWGIGTGTVISGIYVGWQKGVVIGGGMGFVIAFGVACAFFLMLCKVLSDFSISMPYAGGPYGFVRKGLGRKAGFAAGMMELLSLVAITAVVLESLKDYLNFIGVFHGGFTLACLIFIALMLMHLTGLRNASFIQVVLVSIGISTVLMFLGAVNGHQQAVGETMPLQQWQILKAMPYALWFFIGIETVVMAAEETRVPHQSVPIGLYSSFITIAVFALLVVLAVVNAFHPESLSAVKYPMVDLIQTSQSGDPVLAKVFALFSLSFVLSGLNGLIVGYSRISYSLGRGGYISGIFRRVFEKSMAPYAGVLIPSVLAIAMAAIFSLETLFLLACGVAMFVYSLIFLSAVRCYARDLRWYHAIFATGGTLMAFAFLLICLGGFNRATIIMVVGYGIFCTCYYAWVSNRHLMLEAPEELEAAADEISFLVSERKWEDRS